MLLKSTLSEIGLPVKSKLPSNEFFEYLTDKPKLLGRLFKDIQMDGLVNIEEFQAPLLKGVEKLSKLQGEEKYVVDTVVGQLELSNVEYNTRDIQISMIHHYLLNTAYMRTDAKVNMFDFVVELLSNLKMMNISESVQEAETVEDVSVQKMEVAEIIVEEQKLFNVVYVDIQEHVTKIVAVKEIRGILNIDINSAAKIINKKGTVLKKLLSIEEAEEFRNKFVDVIVEIQ